MLTHLWLSSLTASFCRPCPSLDCYLKPTVLFGSPLSTDSLYLLWDLPSLLHFRSCWRSRPQGLCVGFAPKQTKKFSNRRTHTPTQKSPTQCHNNLGVVIQNNGIWNTNFLNESCRDLITTSMVGFLHLIISGHLEKLCTTMKYYEPLSGPAKSICK